MDLPHVLLFLNLGPAEIIFIVLIALLLFGAQKIPDLARSLGRAQKEFNRARQELDDEAAPPAASEDERIRKAAKDLGIPTEGRTVNDLRQAIADRLKT